MGGWTAADIPDQVGRIVVVTGGNSGLGYQTCRALAVRGEKRGCAAIERLRAEAGRELAVEVARLDLADLDSVWGFAGGLVERGAPIDLLVNNAGVGMVPRSVTAPGYGQLGGLSGRSDRLRRPARRAVISPVAVLPAVQVRQRAVRARTGPAVAGARC